MSTRYITGALFALLGGFVVVVSQTLTTSVLRWVAFAIAAGIAAVSLLAQLDRSRGAVQRTLDGATVIVAVLLIVFSLGASGAAVVWLSFAFALGIVALAFAGLSVHEVSNWRTQVHLRNLRWLPDATRMTPPQSRAA
ncbi:MAG TPA: hypothetical protein VE441_15085 [Mycobacterium sp.]|nr:hypothetical protein [Mycobacterium sp.]